MGNDIRRSVSIEAKEHGISGQLMNWLLKTQGRMEGTPGRFHATAKYRKYEHPIKNNFGWSYDPEFFKGVKYTDKAIRKAQAEWDSYKKRQGRSDNTGNHESQKDAKKGFLRRILGFFTKK